MNRSTLYWIVLFGMLLLLLVASIGIGSVYVPFGELVQILTGDELSEEVRHTIIWEFRIPRALTAVVAGAGLSLAGLLMQTLFRNPLAGPFVLGISSGASLGVALIMLAGLGGWMFLVGWGIALAASLGAAAVMLLTLTLALRVRDVMSLLIIGLMIGSLTSALVGIMEFFSTGEEIQTFLLWTFGSLGGLSWTEFRVMTVLVFIGITVSFFLIKPLNALLLSENYARSMGIHLVRTRVAVIVCTSLLAGAITAFCGPIAFVGLAVPHFSRLLFRTSDHRTLLPATLVSGAVIMLACDLVARLPGSDLVLPINAVTSLIGAPVVIWLVLKRGNVSRSF
jgi:iron complex transport system permease protein